MTLTGVRKLKILYEKVRRLSNPKLEITEVLEQFIELALPMSLLLPTRPSRNLPN